MGIKAEVKMVRQRIDLSHITFCAGLVGRNGQRFYMSAALSGSLRCLFLCIVVPLGPAVCLHDIFIRRTTMTPQADGILTARWALTLSLTIWSQKSCQKKCAFKLSSFSHPPLGPLLLSFQVTEYSAIWSQDLFL